MKGGDRRRKKKKWKTDKRYRREGRILGGVDSHTHIHTYGWMNVRTSIREMCR